MNSNTHLLTARILIVDDSHLVRELTSRWLTDAGYACDQAANVSEARKHLKAHQIDLAVLDYRMPGGSGLDLLREMQVDASDVAVLMLTGEGDTNIAVEALTSGAYGYLQKPADEQELLVQVKKALSHRQMKIDNRAYVEGLAAKVREQTEAIVSAHEETVHRLVTASLFRDEETGAHIRRTGEFSECLALRVGWSREAAELLRLAAPMHDVGKIGIADAILLKPGKLTAEETEEMQTHTLIGAKMLANSDVPMLQMAEEIAISHHEHWDGAGYPFGLKGHAIPESARIVGIVDVYDALSHDRVYRPALAKDQVLEILKQGRGKHFDPVLLDAFLDILPEIEAISERFRDDEGHLRDAIILPMRN